MSNPEYIGGMLKETRKKKGYTQEKLAEALSLGTKQSISDYERGKYYIPCKCSIMCTLD